MPATEKLTLTTIPSVLLRQEGERQFTTSRPYDGVRMVAYGTQTQYLPVWPMPGQPVTEEEHGIELPATLAQRLRAYLSNRAGQGRSRNCYDFSLYMAGLDAHGAGSGRREGATAVMGELFPRAVQVEECATIPIGDVGVIGHPDFALRSSGPVAHTFVSLGHNALQLMAYNGALGLTPTAEVLAEYQRFLPNQVAPEAWEGSRQPSTADIRLYHLSAAAIIGYDGSQACNLVA